MSNVLVGYLVLNTKSENFLPKYAKLSGLPWLGRVSCMVNIFTVVLFCRFYSEAKGATRMSTDVMSVWKEKMNLELM